MKKHSSCIYALLKKKDICKSRGRRAYKDNVNNRKNDKKFHIMLNAVLLAYIVAIGFDHTYSS